MPRPKKPEKLKKKKVSITLSPELVEELKREARYKNLSLSEYIEQTLKENLNEDICDYSLKEFGKLLAGLNFLVTSHKETKKRPYALFPFPISIEFWLHNRRSKRLQRHKVRLDFGYCPECPSPHINISLYFWDDKREDWVFMGESSSFSVEAEKIIDTILEIRKKYWEEYFSKKRNKNKKELNGG